jgi:predicted nucleic acid-binding protein
MAQMTKDPGHRFLDGMIPVESSASIAAFDRVLGPQQVTDAYLLALAAQNGAALLTTDGRMAALAENIADLEVLRLSSK